MAEKTINLFDGTIEEQKAESLGIYEGLKRSMEINLGYIFKAEEDIREMADEELEEYCDDIYNAHDSLCKQLDVVFNELFRLTENTYALKAKLEVADK